MGSATVVAGVLHEASGRGVDGQPVGVRRVHAHRPARAGGSARPIRRSQRMVAQRTPRRAPAVADHPSSASNVERPAATRSPWCSCGSLGHGRRKISLSRRLSSRSRGCSVPQYRECIADPLRRGSHHRGAVDVIARTRRRVVPQSLRHLLAHLAQAAPGVSGWRGAGFMGGPGACGCNVAEGQVRPGTSPRSHSSPLVGTRP